MLGLSMGMIPPAPTERPMPLPAGFNWDSGRFPLAITKSGAGYRWDVDPRSLVDPLIWSGPAYHVDGDNGDNSSGDRSLHYNYHNISSPQLHLFPNTHSTQ